MDKDGFQPKVFLARHVERVKVEGSLVGARDISGDQVDALLRVEREMNDSQEVREMELVNGLTSDTAV